MMSIQKPTLSGLTRRACLAGLAGTALQMSARVPADARAPTRAAFLTRGLIDGAGRRYGECAVLSVGGRIADIVPGSPSLDSGAWRVHDFTDYIAAPGLVECHGHLVADGGRIDPSAFADAPERILSVAQDNAAQLVRAGVTSFRDLGGSGGAPQVIRERIRRGEIAGPRIVAAGAPVTIVNGPADFWGGAVEQPEDGPSMVARQIEAGADVIKIMGAGGVTTGAVSPFRSVFAQPVMDEMVASAHRAGLRVAVHCHGAQSILVAARAGADTLEHVSFLTPDGSAIDEAVLAELLIYRPYMTPTLLGLSKRTDAPSVASFKKRLAVASRLYRAGLSLIAGTDAGAPGIQMGETASEAALLTRLGMSNRDAIIAATSLAAEALGRAGEVGQLTTGAAADINFYKDDPEENISVLAAPFETALGGRLVSEMMNSNGDEMKGGQ